MICRIFVIFILYCTSVQTKAADTIIVHKDPRINVLTAKQIAINKVTAHLGSNGLFKGYRLQVLLLENFPDEKAYVLYQSPYFKVRVGNFLNRSDAESFSKEVSTYLSQPAYIVDDMIEYIPKAEDFQ